MTHLDFIFLALSSIQQADDVDEVIDFWGQYRHYLGGWRLVYSHPSISSFIAPSHNWPRNFPGGGFLRPLYAHDNLYFLDDGIIGKLMSGREAKISIDATLVLDTNVARYLEYFIDGRNTANRYAIAEMFDFLIRRKVSFDYSFYALENARNYYAGQNIPSIKRNLEYLLRLDSLDDEPYLRAGELRSQLSDIEISVNAEERLHELYDADDRRGAIEEVLRLYDLIYILLLKVLLIKFRRGVTLTRRVRELYEFMHYELNVLMVREPIIALRYFADKNTPPLFRKVQPSCDDLPKVLAGISWDLMLFRHMELMTATPGARDYLVPYFLSFDKGLVEAYDTLSLKATFTSERREGHYPLWETDPIAILKEYNVFDCIEEFFKSPAQNVRNYERQHNPRRTHQVLKAALEVEVRKLQK